MACVNLARANHLLVSVRGGAHSVAGHRAFFGIGALYAVSSEEGRTTVQPIFDFASPLADFSDVMPYVDAQKSGRGSAFNGRNAAYLVNPAANWEHPAEDADNITWVANSSASPSSFPTAAATSTSPVCRKQGNQ